MKIYLGNPEILALACDILLFLAQNVKHSDTIAGSGGIAVRVDFLLRHPRNPNPIPLMLPYPNLP
jgi:hypothetical protein